MHGSAIALAGSAASAASSASAARRGGFDPGSTLPWAVPLILGAPLVGYVLILGSVLALDMAMDQQRHAA